MTTRITCSISDELDESLVHLSGTLSMSKSSLVELLIRENPRIIAVQRQKLVNTCTYCTEIIGEQDVKINTPTYGLLCLKCWTKLQGKIIERNPIYIDQTKT